MVKEESKRKYTVNPYDDNYSKLNCKIDALEAKDADYKMIDEYL